MGCACGCHVVPTQTKISVDELSQFIYETERPEIAWTELTEEDKKKFTDLAAILLNKYTIVDGSVAPVMEIQVTPFKPETIVP